TCDFWVLRACQVTLQAPGCDAVIGNGGSAFENVASADPLSMGTPQSSITRTCTRLGQPAEILKLSAREVKTGANLEGTHAPSAWRPSFDPALRPAAGVTTSSRLTVRVTAPGNSS